MSSSTIPDLDLASIVLEVVIPQYVDDLFIFFVDILKTNCILPSKISPFQTLR